MTRCYKASDSICFVGVLSDISNYYYFVSHLPKRFHEDQKLYCRLWDPARSALCPPHQPHPELLACGPIRFFFFLFLEIITQRWLFSTWCVFSPTYLSSCLGDICYVNILERPALTTGTAGLGPVAIRTHHSLLFGFMVFITPLMVHCVFI